MVTTRLANTADIPVLGELLAALFAQEAEFTPDDDAQRRGLAALIADPQAASILVLCESDAVIGMVSLLFVTSTALGSRVALLEDMVIAPEQRGHGHGNRLLDAAIAHAREQGCRRITLLTDRDNRIGQRFYAGHGFSESTMLPMRLMLD
jgi:ribosomal protein S18 acetylase RimI-like enzyme